jgi:cyclopropane-fatty-acyl-phospholipid synthase
LTDYLLVFPGGFLPTVNFLVDTLTKGSSGGLVVESISNIGPHYARTLREWRRRFEAKFEDVIVPALQSEYPDVMGPQTGKKGRREIEVFKRKWICT